MSEEACAERDATEPPHAGKEAGLVGTTIPHGVVLPSVRETLDTGPTNVDLTDLATDRLVLYGFSASAGEHGEDSLTTGLVACYLELVAMGVTVIGVSAEPLEILEQTTVRAGAHFRLISDERLILAERLGLPRAPGRPGSYAPIVLVAQRGRIEWAHKPRRGGRHALRQTLSYLQEHPLQRREGVLARLLAETRVPGEGERDRASANSPLPAVRELVRVKLEHIRSEQDELAGIARRAATVLEQIIDGPDAVLHGSEITTALLDTLISLHWSEIVNERYDWAKWPLARWTFDEGFMATVSRLPHERLAGIAWVCAMIACGRAESDRDLAHSQIDTPCPADGTRWSCVVASNAPLAPNARVEYRKDTADQIIFENLQRA